MQGWTKKHVEPTMLAMQEKGSPVVKYGYRADVGLAATYNKILGDEKEICRGEFAILEKSE